MKFKNFSAFITLTTMILVGGISLLVLLFVMLSGIDLLEYGLQRIEAQQTFAAADACTEEALMSLTSDPFYTGATETFGEATCTISVSGFENTRTIAITTSQGNYVNDLQLQVTLNLKPITVDNWEQVH